MDDLPPIKPPGEFTGKGFERIGDPNEDSGQGVLWFRDGAYSGMEFPSDELAPEWSPDTSAQWRKTWRRDEAERLALALRDNPGDAKLKPELTRIRKQCRAEKEKGTLAAIRKILAGGMPSLYPAQDRRERAAIIALSEVAKELKRPPTAAEVMARMLRILDSTDQLGQKLTVDGDPSNQVKFLKSFGFAWLERPPRGFQGIR